MKAIGQNIITTPITETVKTESGILLSAEDANDMRYGKAKVVSTGSEVVGVSEGDTVYYDKRSSYVMVIGGVKYTIIQSRDVVVVD